MAIQTVNLGTGPDTSGSDSHYTAHTKHQANINELDGRVTTLEGTAGTLPVATSAVLGGVKDGTGVTVAGDGTLSVNYGTTAGTAAEGNDSRIVNAVNSATVNTAIGASQVAAVSQFTVAAGSTLSLARATHQGSTIILAGAGATVSLNATSEGDGFVCKIINDTGSDWTVPTPAGATLRFDTSGHTKISAGGSGALETYTRSSTRYLHVVGTTA